ncbi:MAG: class I SAM-dependent methyltransferase [Rudaea sp.]|uniref:class I SAM-dependent methyltransferase n=1 Tax=unclassified Rudaea TaxID=2627037 RepID=UPI0010F4F91F|nr:MULTISPECIES: class I SAM-dependent methyltransferase [unclassified Rudaea]MBN8884540.1 class I SAM-dependent methyltransferase [Rudaea sp.]MBR0346105.1 class I SAM-dependent methyltransferase [Rudaea sp.]
MRNTATLMLALAAALAANSAAFADQPKAPVSPASLGQYSAAAMDRILAGSWRSDANKARDKYRHPKETLAFFGVKPNQTVIELVPSTGWYSEILAPYLKDSGQYIGAVFKSTKADGSPNKYSKLYTDRIAKDPAQLGAAKVVEFDGKAPVFGPPASADVVLTFRNVHNWTDDGSADAMFKAMYAVLKPGGTLGVVDHRAKPGTTLEQDKDSGYLPVDTVVKLATDAGFKLEAQSEVNANPKDTKDYPKGVWTLPPSYALKDVDREKYAAIGESDRMTLKFVKPAN